MKLLIKKRYFDKIKSGDKIYDYRDAHITFICEETKEELKKYIEDVSLVTIPPKLKHERELFEDIILIKFTLMKEYK